MAKTVEEVLRDTGLTDEQIKALDPKVVTGVTTLVTSANTALEQAELAQRGVRKTLDEEINPALDKWANDKAAYETKLAAYEAALKAAKEGGFQVPEIIGKPATDPARNPDGTFVAGKNQVPGSPEFVSNLRKEAGAAIGSMLDLTWKYQYLYGKPMPDSPTVLIAEANTQRMDPVAWASKKYDFSGKEAEIKAAEQKKHDDKLVADAIAENDKKWAEKVGNNPMIRQAEVSRFSTIDKAVKSGERPDPLTMTPEQRHSATRQSILKEASQLETVQ